MVQLDSVPYAVDNLEVPTELNAVISMTKAAFAKLSEEMNKLSIKNSQSYKELTLFVDPIDGTKYFVDGTGEDCTILIGVARNNRSIGGIVYRPLVKTPSYALACAEENFFESHLDEPVLPTTSEESGGGDGDQKSDKPLRIMIRSKTSTSSFLSAARDQLGAVEVKINGTGNKCLKTVEFGAKYNCPVFYIQDKRNQSMGQLRW